LEDSAADESDEFSVVFSSGTTNRPKGVIHTYGARLFAAARDAKYFGLTSQTVNLISTPLSMSMSWSTLLPTMLVGGTSVITTRFDPDEFMRLVRDVSPSLVKLVPTQCEMLLSNNLFDGMRMPSVGTLMFGGSKSSANLRETLRARFPGVATEIYGASESGPISAARLSGKRPQQEVTGRLLPGVTAMCIGTEGGAPEQFREIVVRSRSVMKGYTAAGSGQAFWTDSHSGQKYYRTRDLGKVVGRSLYVHGRTADVIITAGYNVHASDIEAVLSRHPQVHEAAVVPYSDPVLGQTPLGFVVLREGGSNPTQGDVCRWANARLNPHQRLYDVRILERLPRTSVGKLNRGELVSVHAEPRSTQRVAASLADDS
jgi:acyl-CoA synthetase (AMP-forming)/AMP-acid ligase II